MNRPFIAQFLSNGTVRFEELWAELATVYELEYADFQLSAIDLRQMVLDEFFLIYFTDKELFSTYNIEHYLEEMSDPIYPSLLEAYSKEWSENFSQYCRRLSRSIDALERITRSDPGKRISSKVRDLLENLKLRLDAAKEKVGKDESLSELKIKCNLTRDQIIAFVYLLIETKTIEGISKAGISELISDSLITKTLPKQNKVSSAMIKKGLQRDYSKDIEYEHLAQAWKSFVDGPLHDMSKYLGQKIS